LNYLKLDYNNLTGRLPLSFTNLTKLKGLWFAATGLCEPSDAAFQAWKATVSIWVDTNICQAVTYYFYLPLLR